MRDRNHFPVELRTGRKCHSEPTYEGSKQLRRANLSEANLNSEPTYEGSKQGMTDVPPGERDRFGAYL